MSFIEILDSSDDELPLPIFAVEISIQKELNTTPKQIMLPDDSDKTNSSGDEEDYHYKHNDESILRNTDSDGSISTDESEPDEIINELNNIIRQRITRAMRKSYK